MSSSHVAACAEHEDMLVKSGEAGEGGVTVDHVPWLLGQRNIPLAEWLVRMSNKPGFWSSVPVRVLWTLPHQFTPDALFYNGWE